MTEFITRKIAQVQIARAERGDEGATAVEYGVMVALIAVAVMVGAELLGTGLSDLFTDVEGALPAVP